jgi:hypothetical protein
MGLKRHFYTFCSEIFEFLQPTSPSFILPLEPFNFVCHASLNHPIRVAASPLPPITHGTSGTKKKKGQIGAELHGKKIPVQAERRFPQTANLRIPIFLGRYKKNKNLIFVFYRFPLMSHFGQKNPPC